MQNFSKGDDKYTILIFLHKIGHLINILLISLYPKIMPITKDFINYNNLSSIKGQYI